MRSSNDPAQVRAFFAGAGCTCALVVLSVVVARWGEPARGPVHRHVLSEPMVVHAHGGIGVLPVGTVLRFREAIPEGGDFFEVVVRVDALLETEVQEDATWVSPIHAASPRVRLVGDDLLYFLRRVQATREDVGEVAPRLDADLAPSEPTRPPTRPVAPATPLVVEGAEGFGLLPEGTVLQLRDALPGGGEVYEISIRVDRRWRWTSERSGRSRDRSGRRASALGALRSFTSCVTRVSRGRTSRR